MHHRNTVTGRGHTDERDFKPPAPPRRRGHIVGRVNTQAGLVDVDEADRMVIGVPSKNVVCRRRKDPDIVPGVILWIVWEEVECVTRWGG